MGGRHPVRISRISHEECRSGSSAGVGAFCRYAARIGNTWAVAGAWPPPCTSSERLCSPDSRHSTPAINSAAHPDACTIIHRYARYGYAPAYPQHACRITNTTWTPGYVYLVTSNGEAPWDDIAAKADDIL